MNGFSRTFFAMSAAVLRGLSCVFFLPADALKSAASWCERKAIVGALR